MITTGSKWFFGLGFVSLVLAAAYGWTTGGNGLGPLTVGYKGGVGDHFGYGILLSAGVSSASSWGRSPRPSRDADAAAVAQVAGTETVPAGHAGGHQLLAGRRRLRRRPWSCVGLVVRAGAVRVRADRPRHRARRVGGAGLGRPRHRRPRDQPPHPQPADEPDRVPGGRRADPRRVVAVAFSRVFLTLSAEAAVWVGARLAAVVVVGVGFLVAARPRSAPTSSSGSCSSAPLVVIGLGIAGGVAGDARVPRARGGGRARRRGEGALPAPPPPSRLRSPGEPASHLRRRRHVRGLAAARRAFAAPPSPAGAGDAGPAAAAAQRLRVRRTAGHARARGPDRPQHRQPGQPGVPRRRRRVRPGRVRRRCAIAARFRRRKDDDDDDAARADPRQHQARDRLDDPAGRDARRRRLRSRWRTLFDDRRPPTTTPSPSRSPASSGGGSTSTTSTATASTPTRTCSPPTTWSSRPAPTWTSTSSRTTSSTRSGSRRSTARRTPCPAAPTSWDRGRRARHLRRPVHRVLRPVPRLHAPAGRSPSPQDEYEAWLRGPASDDGRRCRTERRDGRRPAPSCSPRQCSGCHLARGINDDEFEERRQRRGARSSRATRPTSPTSSAAARSPAASSTCGSTGTATSIVEADEIGEASSNRGDLEAWLRDPPAEKPMDAAHAPSRRRDRCAACPTSDLPGGADRPARRRSSQTLD